MFCLLWSEHCAYKHSRKLLRRLPTEGPRVLMGPGENAGAVSVGSGWAVAFKVESHNHPSAVEPFQGAATGVGGILRDVFALGARPIAVLDSLRFGELDSERSRYLFDHVVAGIGHYGNSIGVPTVGGEVYFEAPYEQNCLVNAMCVGLARARAHGPRGGGRARQRGRADGRLDRARRDRRRLGARLGRARGGRRLEAAHGPDRRPVRGGEAARVLPRAARARGCWSRCRTSAPPGSPPRRARWRRAAASGSTSTSPGCRCARPTWSRSRSWSRSRRSGCWRWSSRQGGRGARRLRALGDRRRGGRRGDRDGGLPRAARRRGGRRDAGRGAGRRLPALRPRAGRARRLDLRQPRRRSTAAAPTAVDDACSTSARPRRASPASAGRSSSTTRSCSRTRFAAPEPATPRCCTSPRPGRRSRSRSTATGAASPATPTRARSRRCSSAPRTSPASAPSRSG